MWMQLSSGSLPSDSLLRSQPQSWEKAPAIWRKHGGFPTTSAAYYFHLHSTLIANYAKKDFKIPALGNAAAQTTFSQTAEQSSWQILPQCRKKKSKQRKCCFCHKPVFANGCICSSSDALSSATCLFLQIWGRCWHPLFYVVLGTSSPRVSRPNTVYCFLTTGSYLLLWIFPNMERRKTLAAPGYHPYHTTLNLVLADFLGAGIIAQWRHACGLGLRMRIWPIISERRRKEDWLKNPTPGQISIHCIL